MFHAAERKTRRTFSLLSAKGAAVLALGWCFLGDLSFIRGLFAGTSGASRRIRRRGRKTPRAGFELATSNQLVSLAAALPIELAWLLFIRSFERLLYGFGRRTLHSLLLETFKPNTCYQRPCPVWSGSKFTCRCNLLSKETSFRACRPSVAEFLGPFTLAVPGPRTAVEGGVSLRVHLITTPSSSGAFAPFFDSRVIKAW